MKKIPVTYINTDTITCYIEQDEWPTDPREWDNLGTLVLSHKRYNFANEAGIDFKDFESWEEVKNYLIREHNADVILPVQMYDHSGIRIYVGDYHDRWDGGQLGYIFITSEKIREEYGVKRITKQIREQVEQALKHEVDTYSSYANGDVYQYLLRDARGEVVDGCSGYYDTDDIKSEFKNYENITFKYQWETA